MSEQEKQFKTQRWSAKKKQQIVLRLLRGESIDDVSREIGVEVYRLDEWRSKALQGIEGVFKERSNDPLEEELSRAKRQIGDLSMENELLHERIKKKGPLLLRRSK